MRLWSLHPKYLDAKGLVALWREALLAKHVLEGKTKGYKHHPQLKRFKQAKFPLDAINQYLTDVYWEAINRNFNFDKQKINWIFEKQQILVTSGQLQFEAAHLLRKLEKRDYEKCKTFITVSTVEQHPLFEIVQGEVATWEILTDHNLRQ
ncbi:MAG: hypothetical protein KA974_10340 [Saprospiraceae bacterium]|nr:hypothetical protein [Saprospiraceae bacterium]MBP7699386.1 hypothetical protein [Saprospiraceae bacterium]